MQPRAPLALRLVSACAPAINLWFPTLGTCVELNLWLLYQSVMRTDRFMKKPRALFPAVAASIEGRG